MIKTGEILKSAREEKGVSLKEVSDTTRINLSTLEAIERGDMDKLPAKSFLRGFVGSYAKFLELNVNDVLDCFSEEMGSTKPEPAPFEEEGGEHPPEDIPTETAEKTSEKPIPIKTASTHESSKPSQILQEADQGHPAVKIAIVIGCLILLIAIIFTKKIVDKYDREAQVNPPIATETTEPLTDEIDISDEDVSNNIVDNQANSEADTEVAEPATASRPETETTPEPTPREPEPSLAPQAEEPDQEAATETPQEDERPTRQVARPLEVIIEALDTVTVDYRPDGGDLLSKKLEPDSVLTVRANSSLNIDFSDGGAVTVTFNGKDLGVPGNLGQPHKLRLP